LIRSPYIILSTPHCMVPMMWKSTGKPWFIGGL
jgi:hypothetical protein